MKTTSVLAVIAGVLITSLAMPAFAADKAKEVTLTGEGKCAKCAMHETKECQGALQVKESDKTVTYYFAPNKMSKEFHGKICEEAHKVTATGTVEEKDGKKILTASKIELVK